ncbi:MAG: hypothetical protein AB1896_05085, partial [Thermodesulfobacteriota bacterium]
VKFTNADGQEQSLEVDTVILALGRAPNKDLFSRLAGTGVRIEEIGDATGPAKVENAIHTANYRARLV